MNEEKKKFRESDKEPSLVCKFVLPPFPAAVLKTIFIAQYILIHPWHGMDSYIDDHDLFHTHQNSHANAHNMDDAKLQNGIDKTLKRYDLSSSAIYEEMFKIEEDLLNGGSKRVRRMNDNATAGASPRNRRSRSNTVTTSLSATENFDTDTYDNDHDSFNDANHAAQNHLRQVLVNMCKVHGLHHDKTLAVKRHLQTFYRATNQSGMALELESCAGVHVHKLTQIFEEQKRKARMKKTCPPEEDRGKSSPSRRGLKLKPIKYGRKSPSKQSLQAQDKAFVASQATPFPLTKIKANALTKLRLYPSYRDYNAIISLNGPSTIVIGDSMSVEFTMSFPENRLSKQYPHPTDTIAIVPADVFDGVDPLNEFHENILCSEIVPSMQNKGKVQFQGTMKLSKAGEYKALYAFRGRYPHQCFHKFTVRLVDARITVMTSNVRCGSKILISWYRAPYEAGPSDVDWIGLYHITGVGKKKLISRKDVPSAPTAEGQLSFHMPGLVGQFQCLFHISKFDNQVIAASERLVAKMRLHAMTGRITPKTEVRLILASAHGDCFSERQAFQKHAVPHLEEIASLKGMSFTYVNFTREDYNNVTDECLIQMLQTGLRECSCATIFVMLLGNRYGIIPPKKLLSKRFKEMHPWVMEKLNYSSSKRLQGVGAGASVLEMFAHQAFFAPLANSGPSEVKNAYFYLRTPSVVSTEPFSKMELDSFENEAANQDLRGRIVRSGAGNVCLSYSDAKDFCSIVMKDLSEAIKKIAGKSDDLTGSRHAVEYRRFYTNEKHKSLFSEMCAYQKNIFSKYLDNLQSSRMVFVDNAIASSSGKFQDDILIDAWLLHAIMQDKPRPRKKENGDPGDAKGQVGGHTDDLEKMTEELLAKTCQNIEVHEGDQTAMGALNSMVQDIISNKVTAKDIPFIIIGCHGVGKSSILVRWLKQLFRKYDQDTDNAIVSTSLKLPFSEPKFSKLHIVCVHPGETSTRLQSINEVLRFIAYELAALMPDLPRKLVQNYINQSNPDLIHHFPHFLRNVGEYGKVLLCIDGLDKLTPCTLDWLDLKLPPNVSVVLVGAIKGSFASKPRESNPLLADDIYKLLKKRQWLVSGHMLLLKRVDKNDVNKIMLDFVDALENTSRSDVLAALHGPGALAFVELEETPGDASSLLPIFSRVSHANLATNLRALRYFIASFEPYDAVENIEQRIDEFDGFQSIEEAYDDALSDVNVVYARGCQILQLILVSANGLSEEELRECIVEKNTTRWSEFVFAVEPHILTRRGAYLVLTNVDVAAAVLRSFDNEVERCERYQRLIYYWEHKRNNPELVDRATHELGHLYFSMWHGKPKIQKFDGEGEEIPLEFATRQALQHFRVEGRKKMWEFLTNYDSFCNNFRNKIGRHRLHEYFKVLPPLKGWKDGLTVLQDRFLSHFKINRKFFKSGSFQGFQISEVSDVCKSKNIAAMPHSFQIASGLVLIYLWLVDLQLPMFNQCWARPPTRKDKRVFNLCMDNVGRVCSGSVWPEEPLFLLERAFVLLMGKISFNGIDDSSEMLEKRFFGKRRHVFNQTSPMYMFAVISEATSALYCTELFACAELLLGYEHRLPVDEFPKSMKNRQYRLGQYITRMCFTVLIDENSARIKNIVSKTKFKASVISKLTESILTYYAKHFSGWHSNGGNEDEVKCISMLKRAMTKFDVMGLNNN
jgi:hypothetical protein